MSLQTPQAVQSCHELLLWLIPQVEKFPRAHRFTLGERLEERLLEILENLVEAAYSKQKAAPLALANRRLEVCRHLWRVSYELKLISGKGYAHGIKLMDNVGRQIGGWIKDKPANPNPANLPEA